MAKILVIAEQRDGRLKKASLELVSASAQAGNETHVALAGDNVAGLVAELGNHGAKTVHLAQGGELKNATAEALVRVAHAAVKAVSPDAVLASHTPMGRDFMPRLAARLGVGLASDCNAVSLSGGITVRRPIYSGKATAEVEFLGAGPKLLTVRPNSFGAPKATGGSAETSNLTVDLGGIKTRVLEIQAANTGRPDVTEAPIVVSGGRSLKNAENFKMLEDLADVLGAAVGASRAAVDAGYRPHRDQVGQTGKVVSPTLYIACGISGAIQHLAGMRTSKVIVAINSDPEAPIFQVADYGVVGDLFQVVPALKDEVRKLKEH
jgi:electron transfer flavoprotein alpha subunit